LKYIWFNCQITDLDYLSAIINMVGFMTTNTV